MYCKQCGNELSINSIFCGNCGCKNESVVENNLIHKQEKKFSWLYTIISGALCIICLLFCGFLNSIRPSGNALAISGDYTIPHLQTFFSYCFFILIPITVILFVVTITKRK